MLKADLMPMTQNIMVQTSPFPVQSFTAQAMHRRVGLKVMEEVRNTN